MNPENYTRGSSRKLARTPHFSPSARACQLRHEQIEPNRYRNEALLGKCVGEPFSLKKRHRPDAPEPDAPARVYRVLCAGDSLTLSGFVATVIVYFLREDRTSRHRRLTRRWFARSSDGAGRIAVVSAPKTGARGRRSSITRTCRRSRSSAPARA